MSEEQKPAWNNVSLVRLLVVVVLGWSILFWFVLPTAFKAGASSPRRTFNNVPAGTERVAKVPVSSAPVPVPAGSPASAPVPILGAISAGGAALPAGANAVGGAAGGNALNIGGTVAAPTTMPSPLAVVPATPNSNVRIGDNSVPGAAQSSNALFFRLLDEHGAPVQPSAIVQVGDDLYFLGVECLWVARGALRTMPAAHVLPVTTLKPPPPAKLQGVPIQEFLCAVFAPQRQSIVVLDKSGSLYEFLLHSNSWKLMRANKQLLGSPDPHYVSLAVNGGSVLLLDTERNQIWRCPAMFGRDRYFKDVLPWRVRAGDPFVADGVSMVHDGCTYVLKKRGVVARYPANACGGNGAPVLLKYKAPPDVRPSGMVTAAGAPLFLLERENNRVVTIGKTDGKVQQYLFPAQLELRTVLPGREGFWAVGSGVMVWRPMASADNVTARPATRRIDSRLDGFAIPVKGAHLPAHTGVFPGARRLYRHGVHQGLDFFSDAGRVTMNTPALAAEAGKVIRADVVYKDMDAKTYSRVVTDCEKQQFCSDANEDLFRGCQVWIDHGSGLVTRYAHLNRARPDLKPGMKVNRGEVVGFIGVSGTGENTRRGMSQPHLHFEIWLDGHYLGYGLSPAETVGVYEDIFGRIGKRGN